jgi:hypothetical protein
MSSSAFAAPQPIVVLAADHEDFLDWCRDHGFEPDGHRVRVCRRGGTIAVRVIDPADVVTFLTTDFRSTDRFWEVAGAEELWRYAVRWQPGDDRFGDADDPSPISDGAGAGPRSCPELLPGHVGTTCTAIPTADHRRPSG